MPLSRRKLLELLSRSALSVPVLGSLGNSQHLHAARQNGKFLLYIHFGSADGLTSGMLQPHDVVIDGTDTNLTANGSWQKNLFWDSNTLILATSQYKGLVNPNHSINPNVNIHYKDSGSNLIFNEYSKVLHPIREHICFACGNSRSLSHHDAAAFQITGGRFNAARGSWVANFAQALCGNDKFANIVAAPDFSSVRESFYTKIFNNKGIDNDKVALINATSIEEIIGILSDAEGIPEADGDALKFWQTMHKISGSGSPSYAVIKDSVNFYVDNLLAGLPELAPDSPLRENIEKNITATVLKNILNDSSLPSGNVCDVEAETESSKDTVAKLINNLQLAAGMAATQRAKGMMFAWGDHDCHSHGSSLDTPRHAAVLFAAINMFWQWVKAQKMQDDVLVIVSHDFSRTPYNSREITYQNETDKPIIKARAAGGAINDHRVIPVGNDHQSVMGMLFVNGNVPAAGRIGGISDNYLAFGSDDTAGIPNLNTAPYTSDELVGTMLMRCFSDVFKDEKTLQEFFPNFKAPIAWLLE